jgi:cysteine synthase B
MAVRQKAIYPTFQLIFKKLPLPSSPVYELPNPEASVMTNLTAQVQTGAGQVLKKLSAIRPFVGNTPLFPIAKYSTSRVKIYAKLEWLQYGGSVKTKPAFQMLWDALASGKITDKTIVADASSGNTGIAMAHFCSKADIPLRIYIPEKATIERKAYLHALGVEVVYTDKDKGTDYAREVVKRDVDNDPDRFFLVDQYSNTSNIRSHYRTTGPEVWRQSQGRVTHFCCGLGTSGTFMGTSQYLKERNADIVAIGLQPQSPDHGLEGWKHLATASIPKIFDHSRVDQDVFVDTSRVIDLIKEVAREEGLLLSPSSAANLLGAIEVADSLDEGIVVTVFPDDASKYNDLYRDLFV